MNPRYAEALAGPLRAFVGAADLAVVLGSGLSALERFVAIEAAVPYAEIPGLFRTTVAGHPGRCSLARAGSRTVLLFAGRFHCYEGLAYEDAVAPVSLAAALGASRMLLTHAAGGLHAGCAAGSWMLPTSVICLPARAALAWPPPEAGAAAHRGRMLAGPFACDVREAARRAGVPLSAGVLAWTMGPSYETAAEARAFVELGADAVTMSLAPELREADRCALSAAALGWITNLTANVSGGATDHRSVVASGDAGARLLARLLAALPERTAGARKIAF